MNFLSYHTFAHKLNKLYILSSIKYVIQGSLSPYFLHSQQNRFLADNPKYENGKVLQ